METLGFLRLLALFRNVVATYCPGLGLPYRRAMPSRSLSPADLTARRIAYEPDGAAEIRRAL
jgi:hypothetical protein